MFFSKRDKHYDLTNESNRIEISKGSFSFLLRICKGSSILEHETLILIFFCIIIVILHK